MREDRATKRAVSEDFWISKEPYEEGFLAKMSSEGALLESAPEEAGLDVASSLPVHGDLDA